MALVINTNIASLNAQRNLTASQSSLQTSLQRLSSGLRINSAKDDAAGLAIATRMTAQVNGLNQAARNANDGISLAQTAEGDLDQITNNLQRIRELAVQSTNASNNSTDRASMQAEASQLIAEIDRVAANSKFNGVNLLDGTFTGVQFQVGANNTVNDRVTVSSIDSARTTDLGASYSATVTSGVVSAAATGSAVTLNGVTVLDSANYTGSVAPTYQSSDSAYAKARAINATTGVNVTATASTAVAAAGASAASAHSGTIVINGVATATLAQTSTAAADTAAAVTAINNISGATGVIASGDDTTGITLTAADGRNVVVSFTGTTAAADYGMAGAGTTRGTLVLTSKGSTGITAGGTVAIIGSPATQTASKTGTAVAALDISTVAGAQAAIDSVDSALTTVSSTRGSLGALQNRFQSVVASLQTASENTSAARSRIQDADFAAETANLTRSQILQQAGTAMLAQANALPQSVLTLLK